MKKLLLSLLLIACVKVAGQEPFSLKDKAYTLTDSNNPVKECAQQKILFVSDSSFVYIVKCKDIETLGSGRYTLNKKGITLNFENTIVVKQMDANTGYEVYTDSLIAPKSVTLKSFTKKKKLQFKEGKQIMAPSDSYLGIVLQLEADNRLIRLGMAKKKNIAIFKGMDFSKQNDSLIIQRGLDKLNGEMALDYFDEDNKLIGSLNGGYSEGEVHYAPDGRFKIFNFTGEGCGAHCSNIFTTYVQLPSGKVHTLETLRIIRLEKYDDTKYLTISTAWGGGASGGHTMALTLFSVGEDGVTYHTLAPEDSNDPALRHYFRYDVQDFEISCPWYGFDHLKMEYDPTSKRITYSYLATDYTYGEIEEYLPAGIAIKGTNEGLVVSGSFVLADGRIGGFRQEYRVVELE
ncbi:hypothetical protein [uncultured Flavobacterium sp.]|uniref:hypothetical protein n=1 Tax=uncultured Flavobacterium sp. TaxID=165435 RepID=UPI0025E7D8C0|nr:hypothetical protein [uncultured Flavobacterium sp.]